MFETNSKIQKNPTEEEEIQEELEMNGKRDVIKIQRIDAKKPT